MISAGSLLIYATTSGIAPTIDHISIMHDQAHCEPNIYILVIFFRNLRVAKAINFFTKSTKPHPRDIDDK